MALQLTVPEHSTRVLANVELNSGKVEKWLASLPLLNLAEGGGKLVSSLKIYNRIDLDPAHRLELLELYRAPVKHIVTELQKLYIGLPLPLPDKHKNAAEQHREFELELAFGYKQVVLAQGNALRTGARAAADNALAVQRAIHHLTQVLFASFLSYSPCPLNVWRDIHALYTHAERLTITGIEVTDTRNGTLVKTTVAHAYKHALLLDLGDPYHLSARMIVKINQYLEHYADLASLHRSFERIEPNCHFLIDLEGDRAGMLYSTDTVLEHRERYCLLNTIELARRIHLQLMNLQNGSPAPCTGLPEEFYKSGGQEMLLRLINVWGVNPKRGFRRTARTNAKVEIAIGLDAISYWLNGGRRFVTSAELVGPFPQRTNVGVFAKVQGELLRSENYDYSAWDLKDDSAGGMSLRKDGAGHRRVKVGDLITARQVRNDGWAICAVRWVKSANPSNVEIGIQRLAPSAIPVVIKVMSDDGKESDFQPALLLPPIPALKEPETLVTPCNIYRPKRTLYLDTGMRLSRATAETLVEATAGFERFAFTIESPA